MTDSRRAGEGDIAGRYRHVEWSASWPVEEWRCERCHGKLAVQYDQTHPETGELGDVYELHEPMDCIASLGSAVVRLSERVAS